MMMVALGTARLVWLPGGPGSMAESMILEPVRESRHDRRGSAIVLMWVLGAG